MKNNVFLTEGQATVTISALRNFIASQRTTSSWVDPADTKTRFKYTVTIGLAEEVIKKLQNFLNERKEEWNQKEIQNES